jgi:cell division protein FtsW (lipid II flippase)
MTKTVRGSKWAFWVAIIMLALTLTLFFTDEDQGWSHWSRVLQPLLWATASLLTFRSWRVLSGRDSESGTEG